MLKEPPVNSRVADMSRYQQNHAYCSQIKAPQDAMNSNTLMGPVPPKVNLCRL